MPESPSLPYVTRLEATDAADRGAVLVTSNRRLAAVLKREFDERQRAAGRQAWPTPDILPWSAWLVRCHDDARRRGDPLPQLLSPLQDQALWELAVAESRAGSGLLQPASAAADSREAWALAHDWDLVAALKSYPPNEDGRAFDDWMRRYGGQSVRLNAIDAARLPALCTDLLRQGRISAPERMILCGFDRVTPAQQALLEALALRGSALAALSPPERHGHAGRVSFASQAEEIAAAAGWARERLALNPDARIGVVVPGLAEVRARLARAFTDAMDPGARLPGRGPDALPFNVSLGLPLCDWPMVHTALSLLQLARGALELNLFGALVRSPFLGGAEAEGAARARLDAKLREIGEMEVGLAAASHLAGEQGPCHCPELARSLGALAEIHAGVRGRNPVSVWSRAFMDLLRAAGFPGERTLSSAEYQTLARWRELLGSLSTLDPVTGRVDFDTALSRLRRIAADSVFQPETPELPIQVLGMLEAAGQEFDHLWVMGLSDEAWPPAPRPNPFLPVGLQRRAGLPNASASERLEFARRLTAGWLCAAGEVILSSPRREDDRELGASPLIASIPEREAAALRIPALPDHRRLLHPASTLTELEDWRAPPVQPGIALPHGTAVFADQAACPFRAFAIHRLDARGVAVPEAGLGPRERGMLVHDVLAQVWRRIRSQAALVAMEEPERLEIIAEAARRALARASRDRPRTLSGRFLELERERLTRLVRDWLQRELERLPFEVAAVEDKRSLQVGSLLINARLDRVDRLPEGRTLIIDYKTGRTSVAKWLGPRPEEPQLPLYAVAAGEEVAAVAFAQVRSGDMKLSGFARDADILPEGRAFTDTKHASGYAGWDGLLAAWRSELERLAAQFAAGEAAVDPKRYPGTCEYCELGPLCRVEERRRAGPEDESDE